MVLVRKLLCWLLILIPVEIPVALMAQSEPTPDIRSVDLKNFTYASFCRSDSGDMRIPLKITTRDGYWGTTAGSPVWNFIPDLSNLVYGDFLHDGKTQAVLPTLCFDASGAPIYSYINVIEMVYARPRIVAFVPSPEGKWWGWGYPVIAARNGSLLVTYESGGTAARHQWENTTTFTGNGTAMVAAGSTRRPAPKTINCKDPRHKWNPQCDVEEGAP